MTQLVPEEDDEEEGEEGEDDIEVILLNEKLCLHQQRESLLSYLVEFFRI